MRGVGGGALAQSCHHVTCRCLCLCLFAAQGFLACLPACLPACQCLTIGLMCTHASVVPLLSPPRTHLLSPALPCALSSLQVIGFTKTVAREYAGRNLQVRLRQKKEEGWAMQEADASRSACQRACRPASCQFKAI